MIGLPLPAVEPQWVDYIGKSGPGKGKHIVLLSGDEEYRSEEGLPQLAKILALRHGFKCTVLFSINPKGEIDPNVKNNEPGLEQLDHADLCIMLLRFRQWPDEQMAHFANYYLAGKPIIALRTSTHAFNYPAESRYAKFGWQSTEWPGGFGKHVLGETWVSHWGNHGSQGTRGIVDSKSSSLLKGVENLTCATDVYEADPPEDAQVLMRGEVMAGLTGDSPAAIGKKKTARGDEQGLNDPMMPIAWTRTFRNERGKVNKIFTTTIGAATDLLNEGVRRLLVNGVYWAIGLEHKIDSHANVDLIGTYRPSSFGFEAFRKGVKPSELTWPPSSSQSSAGTFPRRREKETDSFPAR